MTPPPGQRIALARDAAFGQQLRRYALDNAWSYRAADFRKSNRGLRLDHIWTSPGLTPAVVRDTARIHDDVREWDRPSDHAPVTVDLDV